MKKYTVEIVIFCIQLFMFYISPLFAGPTDGMGMVVLILFATLILSILLGSISTNRIKYVYPAAVAAAFLPSVFLHYNGNGVRASSLVLCCSGSWHVDRNDHF